MGKFTKGKWVAIGAYVKVRSYNIPDLCSCDPKAIQGHLRRLSEEACANAQLMAAAPRMLKALKKAIKDYGKPGGPWNVPNEPGTWIALAHAAIQAAEGK